MTKKKTFAATTHKSPNKKGALTIMHGTHGSPNRARPGQTMGETDGPTQGTLSSPTSVSMKNTFIIKNADESFDINSKLIPKLKGAKTINQDAAPKLTSFVEATRPTPRDGHSALVDNQGRMYVFGGDRHHMPFNDLYMIKLE